MKPLITVVTPCYNEAGNVVELYERIKAAFATIPDVRYEQLFIDNASTDDTVKLVKELAAKDPNVQLIVNIRNFGHVRSPHHAFLQAQGDAVIGMASDLQDPPELIPQFVQKWREGAMVVMGVKEASDESGIMYWLRGRYYDLLQRLSDVRMIRNATGFGLYDQQVVDMVRRVNDPYPYVRGLVCELGYAIATVPYHQPVRKWGLTKNNFYTLYDVAMLGITSHSKVPLRIAVWSGTLIATLSLAVSFIYFVAKIVYWDRFPAMGGAPTVVGLFFFGGVQLIFTGILGEYIGDIHTRLQHRPLVIEKERVNLGPPI